MSTGKWLCWWRQRSPWHHESTVINMTNACRGFFILRHVTCWTRGEWKGSDGGGFLSAADGRLEVKKVSKKVSLWHQSTTSNWLAVLKTLSPDYSDVCEDCTETLMTLPPQHRYPSCFCHNLIPTGSHSFHLPFHSFHFPFNCHKHADPSSSKR